MSPEYSAWLRENPTLLALIVVAVAAGVAVIRAERRLQKRGL